MARVRVIECAQKIGERVELAGWVDVRRDHGKLIFIDLRDESGIVQMVATPKDKKLHALADMLRPEWVIRLWGTVKKRPEGMENADLPTGQVEIGIEKLEVLNEAETPPFDITGTGLDINDELRLEYRYLDLRRGRLQRNLRLRDRATKEARKYLEKHNFIEIETPLLTKSTPEGSRDFLVPSRLQPGKFYALPQSPQQYKELLMIAGFERYFQFARALRDEDLRADRSFEHTQIDLEMSFVEREDVMNFVEGMYISVFKSLGFTIKEGPFPRYSYADAMNEFGADKFDLRDEEEKKDNKVLAFAWVIDFPLFEKTDEGKLTYSHNPFTGPKVEHEDQLMEGKNLESIISQQYDLVCNGHEVGGGGIRITKEAMLRKVFKILGHTSEKIEQDFGHILRAFRYGAPPEGGIALGWDRIIAIAAGEASIREVQAFPTTSGGRTSVMDAPSEVADAQLKELGISVIKREKK